VQHLRHPHDDDQRTFPIFNLHFLDGLSDLQQSPDEVHLKFLVLADIDRKQLIDTEEKNEVAVFLDDSYLICVGFVALER
jgi:hypothetical protein